MEPIIARCPHCHREYDITYRLHNDRIWCVSCGKWSVVIQHLDLSLRLAKCEAPNEEWKKRNNVKS